MSNSQILAVDAGIRLCDVDGFVAGEMRRFHPEGMDAIVVCNLDGEFYAVDDDCTHAIASLSEGRFEDGLVICPVHGGSFDVKTGEAMKRPCRKPLRTWPVSIIDDAVWINASER